MPKCTLLQWNTKEATINCDVIQAKKVKLKLASFSSLVILMLHCNQYSH